MGEVKFESFKFVSFDIFDTLLHRLVRAPVDVFELVRLRSFEDSRSLLYHQYLDEFVRSRMLAEAKSREHRVKEYGGEGEVTLDEIYDQWMRTTNAPKALADWLKTLELECESRVLYASNEGKQLYDAARAAGCLIFFISDMYLPADFLRDRLVAEGFGGADAYPLYVSGNVRLSKHQGNLYNHVAADQAIEIGLDWLHIGDNFHSDVAMASKTGLTAHHATWAKINNVPTVLPGSFGCGSIARSFMDALTEPHAKGRLPEDPLARIGYQIWGPMLFGFTCWLISQFRSSGIQHAVFVARDGWLMSKLIEICVAKLPTDKVTIEYFFMSRKTGYKTGIRDWHPARTWYYAAGKSRTSADKVFSAAGLDAENYRETLKDHGIADIEAALSDEQKQSVVQALNSVHMDVLRRNAENRRSLGHYYDMVLSDRSGVALIDIGWVGNIQRCFLHSLGDPDAARRVFGLFLGLHQAHIGLNAELGMNMQGWLNGSDKYERFNQALLSGGVELLEFILTAPHGSTIDLKKDGDGIVPVLEQQGDLELEHQALAARAQAGVIRFVEDYAFLLDWLSPGTLANTVWADGFLRLVIDPDDDAINYLADVTHSDGPGANDARLVLAPRLSSSDASKLRVWEKKREDAFWKAAFDRLNPRPIA